MLYIIEGVDGSGKTTLVKNLSMLTGMRVYKGSSFEQAKTTNEELFAKFKELAKLDDVVLDRYIYSNLVYASLYNDYSILNNEQVKIIENMIKDKVKLIYLYANVDTIIERIKKRGDDYVEVDMIKRIMDKYNEVLKDSSLPILKIDTSINSPVKTLMKVLGVEE